MKNCNFSNISPSYGHRPEKTGRPNIVRRILILTLFALVAGVAAAASVPKVRGTVRDAQGNPLAFSTVMFAPLADTLAMRGDIANEQGYFDIPAGAGEHLLVVSMLGYESYRTTVALTGDTDLGKIVLNESAVAMDAVTVRGDMIRRRADGYVFNPAGSPIVAGRTSYELLNFAPGVWTSREGGISINGKGGTRVMVNDRMINLSGEELISYLEGIDAEQIRTIEVIPETGAQYDADSGGGILKITLKRSSTAGLTGSMGINLEMRDDYMEAFPAYLRPSLNLDYRKDRLSLYTAWTWQDRNQLETATEETRYLTGGRREIDMTMHNPERFNSYSGRLGGVYELTDRQSVGLETELVHSKVNNGMDASSIIREGSYRADAMSHAISKNTTDRYSLSFNYKLKTDEKGSGLTVVADYMRNERPNYESNLSTETPATGEMLRTHVATDQLTATNIYTARFDYKHYLSTKYQLEAGAKYAYTDMDTDTRQQNETGGTWTPDPDRSDHYLYREGVLAGYVNATADLGDWNVVAGLRAENTALRPHSYTHPGKNLNQNYTDLFPSVRAAYFFDKKKGHMISAGYSRRIRRPSFLQLNPYRTQMNNYTYFLGNPDLKPYYIDSYTMTGVLANKFNLSLGVTDMKGYFSQIVLPDPENEGALIYQVANVDRMTQYTAMFSGQFNPAKWWRASVDAGYMYTKNKLSSYELNSGMFQGRINNVFTGPKNWGADASYTYLSGGAQGNMLIDSFGFLNAGIRKGFFDNKLTASFSVRNVFDDGGHLMSATIEDPGRFVKRLYVRNGNSNVLPRTYTLSLRWSFKAGKEVRVQKVTAGNAEERER
jgi:outer membrane receptor protein involved in Fe transport